MDILTHIVSGVAVGSVVAAFAASKPVSMKRIFAAGALGGAFPDIDAISLWSKFDTTIGKWLGLAHNGKDIYFGKFWYSHHGFFHSIAAAIIVGFLIGCGIYFYRWMRMQRENPFLIFFRENLPVYLAFVLGCLAHAAGDFLTPASAWGGVRLLWPLTDYVGGWGKVWWWNNYDVFLIISGCALLNIILILSANFIRFRVNIITLVVFLLAFAGVWRQVETRNTSYAYAGHTKKYNQLEEKSKEEQRHILGTKAYRAMTHFDEWLPLNF